MKLKLTKEEEKELIEAANEIIDDLVYYEGHILGLKIGLGRQIFIGNHFFNVYAVIKRTDLNVDEMINLNGNTKEIYKYRNNINKDNED